MIKPAAPVLWFKDISQKDLQIIGFKGLSLAEMTRIGIPTPNGFIVTKVVLADFLSKNSLRASIEAVLGDRKIDSKAKSQKIAKILRSSEEMSKLELHVQTAYECFPQKNCEVAIRPSTFISNDDKTHVLGQQETLLNVKGVKEIVNAILLLWTSFLIENHDKSEIEKGVAIVVQAMVQSTVSGVLFTHNPVNNDKSVVVVESILGLGEMIMRGAIIPDHFEVDRRTLRIVSKQVMPQEKQLVKIAGDTKVSSVPRDKVSTQKVSDGVIVRVAKLGLKIQKYYRKPQVVEWAYKDGRIFVFEAKTLEEENLQRKKHALITVDENDQMPSILSGACANSGAVIGKVFVIKNEKDVLEFRAGSVLVTSVIHYDQIAAMKKAVAIITDEGGQTSDAAILSRELGIPCVVGTGKATKLLKNGETITVDATKGYIFRGEKKTLKKTIALPSGMQSIRDIQTRLQIMASAAEPEMAHMMSQKYIDGIGLLQPEFIISEYIGVHPKALIEKGRRKFFVDKLAEEVGIFCENFGSRPVLYKLSDFKTNQYRALQSGEKFEDEEQSISQDFHGCARMLVDEEMLAMELDSVKKVREKMGHTNLHIAIPCVRTVDELQDVKSIMAKHGLARRHNFKLYMVAQLPQNIFMLDEYIDVGIDGLFADIASLHALSSGLEHNNENMKGRYQSKDPGLARMLEIIVKTAKRRGIRSYMGGNLDLVTTETLKQSIAWGISGISVRPGLEEYMRLIAYDVEKRDENQTKKSSGVLRKLIGL